MRPRRPGIGDGDGRYLAVLIAGTAPARARTRTPYLITWCGRGACRACWIVVLRGWPSVGRLVVRSPSSSVDTGARSAMNGPVNQPLHHSVNQPLHHSVNAMRQ